jgi:soluble epoxide hydrolase / lipid-phosphate phosphatase
MTMVPSLYKDLDIDGLQYHYYYHPPKSTDIPTLLFLHGFPSTSDHWVHQVAYFSSKGYGVIAPDMLGYGGTSKPVDHKAIRRNETRNPLHGHPRCRGNPEGPCRLT